MAIIFSVIQFTEERQMEYMTFILDKNVFDQLVPDVTNLGVFSKVLAKAMDWEVPRLLPNKFGAAGVSPHGFSKIASSYKAEFNKAYGVKGQHYPMLEFGTIYVSTTTTIENTISTVKNRVNKIFPGLITSALPYVIYDPKIESNDCGWS